MNIDVLIPSDDCVRLISQFVEEMDLTALYGTYERMPAENHASPDIMLKLPSYSIKLNKQEAGIVQPFSLLTLL